MAKFQQGDKVRTLVHRLSVPKGSEVFIQQVVENEDDTLLFRRLYVIKDVYFEDFELELIEDQVEEQVGKKFDSDKADVGLVFESFPRALYAVAEVATFGAKKYDRGNWRFVDNKDIRYRGALGRHLLSSYLEDNADDSQLSHLAHAAWNALAILEIYLEEKK